MVTGKVNNHLSASNVGQILGENRESGANPERYRHCKRGGGCTGRKPVIGEFPEKAVRRLTMRKVRITAKDGLCVGLLQVWGQATFGAENRLRRYVDRRSFFVSQLPVQAGSPWPMSGLPSWDTVCVVSSGGEFAHSPPFLIALWAGSHTVVPWPTRFFSYAFSWFPYGSALAHPVSFLRWKPEVFGR